MNTTTVETPSPRAAWQLLGKEVKPTLQWEAACKEAELDWEVEKRQLLDPVSHKPVASYGICRKDTGNYFGFCGEGYTPLQNRKVFSGVDSFVRAEEGVHYAGAGAHESGVWCLVSIPDEIRIKGTDDITRTGLMFENFHKPGQSARVRLYTLRLVCTNGTTRAVVEQALRFPHFANVDMKVDEAHKSFARIQQQIHATETVMNSLASVQMGSEQLGMVLKDVFPEIEDNAQQANRARAILELFEGNDNGAFPKQAGSAYALYNATTNYVDHEAGARARTGENTEQARARSSLFGVGEVLKFTMLNSIVMSLTKASLLTVSQEEARALGISL